MNADDIRAHCKAITEYDARVEQIFEAANSDGDARLAATVRCTAHAEAKAPLLAQIFEHDGHLLAISRIEFIVSDKLALRSWMRRDLLKSIPAAALDDVALTSYLEQFATWTRGVEPTGPRWLLDLGPQSIRDVLSFEEPADGSVRPEFWTRCRRHPGEARRWRPENLRRLL